MKSKILVIWLMVVMMILGLTPQLNNNVQADIIQHDFVLWAGATPTFINDLEQGYMKEATPTTSDTTSYANILVRNETGTSLRGMFRFNLNQTHPDSIIYSVKLKCNITLSSGFIGSMNVSIHSLLDSWEMESVCWDYRVSDKGNFNNESWQNQGGDYNSTEIDTIMISSNGTYEWNITLWYRNVLENGTENLGLIFSTEDTSNSKYVGIYGVIGPDIAILPRLNITYSEPSTPITRSLTKDIWNLRGFANTTSKLASAIYSEITNCTAISWKNATTGYWYTYWPSLGLTEDSYLEFGDGLFILTSQDTTWDHT